MINKRIKFDERYDNEEYETTTLYFIAPKDMFIREYPKAVEMEISIEFPKDCDDAPCVATVGVAPRNEDGECFDWYEIDLPYSDIAELIELAEETEKAKTKVYYIELHTDNGLANFEFDTQEAMQNFINTLNEEEKENIATIYKYTKTEDSQYNDGEPAWNDFIID